MNHQVPSVASGFFSKLLEALYENRAQATAGTKAIVKFITGRAWVMTDVGDGVFAFTHQTFLEYFFARFVDEKADTVTEVLDEIIPHVLRREWDVVAQLSLQIKTHRSLRRQNQAIEQLIALLGQSRPLEEQRALAIFAARSLEYLIASESQVKALVELVFSDAIAAADDEEFLRAIRHCAFCSVERRAFVRKLLVDLIVKTFKKGEQPGIGNLFKGMSSISVRGDRLIQSGLLPPDIQTDAREALRRMVVDRAPASEFFASVAWSWFRVINEELLKKHGFSIYFNTQMERSHYGVDGLTNLVLGGSERYSRPPYSPEVYVSALIAVGRVGFAGPPLDRKKFRESLSPATAPLRVWAALVKYYKKDPDVLAGAFFVFLLVTSLAGERARDKDDDVTPADITNEVLNSRAIKKLEIYPQMVRLANESVFGTGG